MRSWRRSPNGRGAPWTPATRSSSSTRSRRGSATRASCAASHRGATGPSPMASAVHIALGIQPEGTREVLGLWTPADRRGEVLAPGHERAQGPRRGRRAGCRRRQAQGLPRGDRGRVPRDGGPNLHRPPRPAQPRVHLLEGPPRRGARAARDLPRRRRRGRARGLGRLRGRALGREAPRRRAGLAAELGSGDPLLRLPRGRAPDWSAPIGWSGLNLSA